MPHDQISRCDRCQQYVPQPAEFSTHFATKWPGCEKEHDVLIRFHVHSEGSVHAMDTFVDGHRLPTLWDIVPDRQRRLWDLAMKAEWKLRQMVNSYERTA